MNAHIDHMEEQSVLNGSCGIHSVVTIIEGQCMTGGNNNAS